MSMLKYPAAWALNSDFDPVRTHHSAHPSLVPFQASDPVVSAYAEIIADFSRDEQELLFFRNAHKVYRLD